MTTASAEEFRLQASSLEWGDHIWKIRCFANKIQFGRNGTQDITAEFLKMKQELADTTKELENMKKDEKKDEKKNEKKDDKKDEKKDDIIIRNIFWCFYDCLNEHYYIIHNLLFVFSDFE